MATGTGTAEGALVTGGGALVRGRGAVIVGSAGTPITTVVWAGGCMVVSSCFTMQEFCSWDVRSMFIVSSKLVPISCRQGALVNSNNMGRIMRLTGFSISFNSGFSFNNQLILFGSILSHQFMKGFESM